MKDAPLAQDAVTALRGAAVRFDDDAAARKAALLGAAASASLAASHVGVLLAYHDTLLFLIAYPQNAALRAQAARELARVAAALGRGADRGPARVRAKLVGTGVPGSSITIAFGLPIVRWLLERYPGCAELDSFGDGGARLAAWLRLALPSAECALVDANEDDPDALIAAASEGFAGGRLAWLVAALDRVTSDEALREALYDALDAFVVVRPGATALSRTFARGPDRNVYYHRAPLVRGADVPALLAEPLPPEPKPTLAERRRLTDAGRAVLAMLGRETDPITYADPARTRYVVAGRGVALALYSATPERRPPFDSHVGYVLFKNGVPVGYGGGWPFLGRCRTGINIFPAFRGGESAYLMASVLRVYARLFAVERFVVEPYQFGAGNREGLQSGAFWFYYRLGFRPEAPKLRALADAEFARMSGEPGYRSPLAVLRRFTRSDLELVLTADRAPGCDATGLSEAATAWIAARFAGDRSAAMGFAEAQVLRALGKGAFARAGAAERAALRGFAPVLAQIPDLGAWPARDKAKLVAVIKAKAGDEYAYFATMASFPRLRAALGAVAVPRG